jgi:transcriptional regulator with XRE-family HTH domain
MVLCAMKLASTNVTTGLDLKLLRIERGITQTDLAHQMGVWRQTVSIIEAALRPGPDRIERYLKALDAISAAGAVDQPGRREPAA